MKYSAVFVGQRPLQRVIKKVSGQFVEIGGERYYKIAHYDQMRSFFMSIVSNSDHWMFISSNGALTAGRESPENALFPYYTDDKIHNASHHTGSKTLLLVHRAGRTSLWEPFSDRYQGVYDIERNLYKSPFGNKLLFEEINLSLGLSFQYAWNNSDRFGFAKHVVVKNLNDEAVAVSALDGIQNVLPHGVEQHMQSNLSTLLDAYKKNELEKEAGLGIFRLSSLVVDKAEPTESLRATTVWSVGVEPGCHLLSSRQLDAFRKGNELTLEEDVRAEKGAYFIESEISLAPNESRDWYIVAEVNQGPADVVELLELLKDKTSLQLALEKDIEHGTAQLERIVAQADGLQKSADDMVNARHYSNVLFNVMRGGLFHENGVVKRDDLQAFIAEHNSLLAVKHQRFLNQLPRQITLDILLHVVKKHGDLQLERLCYEYLPLTFSRRHGDPSRPWNKFSINIRNADGSVQLSFQGNWRDIFQNWEALLHSYPAFSESVICKFVNASTPDGYNPYRISRSGIDWEVTDPDDPWSNIGYWGDHQVIYLLKLLELSFAHHPGNLKQFLAKDLFTYANVPYEIKSYEALLSDPHDTIVFNGDKERRIAGRVQEIGADGKLIYRQEGGVYQVNLSEKLLVLVLAKLSNFIPEGGIWMNTQRPEWNDANNALVGYGISMVTLCYLRRFAQFAAGLFDTLDSATVSISVEVAAFFKSSLKNLLRFSSLLNASLAREERLLMLNALGEAGSDYRSTIYSEGFSGVRESVELDDIKEFFDLITRFFDHTITANQRPDKLFHSYNLMSQQGEGLDIESLYEMLEGQVAAISSGRLAPGEVVEILEALKSSAIYREDQYSYLLYPDRQLARFVDQNNIPGELLKDSALFRKLEATGHERLIIKNARGAYHFAGTIKNKHDIHALLDELAESGYTKEVAQDRDLLLRIFEDLFDHRSYTGRSGTFYGYEGLGSIYWHMVSKLVLAIQEAYVDAFEKKAEPSVLGRLVDYYYEARAGIGLNKSPDLYGAFPFDPYSHTPGNKGVQQPGLTGQVKEDILSRWGELGVVIEAGKIQFKPLLLRKAEFLAEEASFKYYDIDGYAQTLQLPKGSLGFTYCQTPIRYFMSGSSRIVVTDKNSQTSEYNSLVLDEACSENIFQRNGEIKCVDVYLMPGV